IIVGFSSTEPPVKYSVSDGEDGTALMDSHGIADERPYYAPYASLLAALHGRHVSDHPWAVDGIHARNSGDRIVVRGDIGYFGFYAGPRLHIVDVWGVGDPLLARLPARKDRSWRIGHFVRAVPLG